MPLVKYDLTMIVCNTQAPEAALPCVCGGVVSDTRVSDGVTA